MAELDVALELLPGKGARAEEAVSPGVLLVALMEAGASGFSSDAQAPEL